jgi:ribosomal protein S12 methylthiotransferase
MKAYLVSLGCPKNTVDAEASLGLLKRAGCGIVDDPKAADLLIVNACSFLDAAWRETVEEVEGLARIKKAHPPKTLVLMGCLPIHRDDGWRDSVPAVDCFIPAGDHAGLTAIVGDRARVPDDKTRSVVGGDRFAGFENRPRLTPRHTAYVKIADGCDHTCAFCAIPMIRGGMTSRPAESIVREVEGLAADGVKEISLLAQDITSYSDGRRRLPDLVDSIARTGIEWVRVFYLHPGALTVDLARRIFEHPSVCRYLEIPVQHASDRILEAMGRRYTRKHIEHVIEGIRREFPDVVIRSEVMVGYPGEEDEDFDRLKDFIASIGFASLGVFTYSPEPRTPAVLLEAGVPRDVASDRAVEIADIQKSVTFGVLSDQKGKRHRILVDRAIDTGVEACRRFSHAGRYYGQALDIDGEVYIEAVDLAVGEFVEARITEANAFDLEARVDHPQRP